MLPLLYIAQVLLIDLYGCFERVDLAQLDDPALELEITAETGGESVGLALVDHNLRDDSAKGCHDGGILPEHRDLSDRGIVLSLDMVVVHLANALLLSQTCDTVEVALDRFVFNLCL